MLNKVPDGWYEARLGDVARIVTGKTPSTKEPRYWSGDIPFVTPSDITESPWLRHVERHVSDEGATCSSRVPAGSVLFTCIASIGKSCITQDVSTFNQQINACVPLADVDAYFLYNALQVRVGDMLDLAGTTAVPIINKTTFSKIVIKLPPLDEQRRIAEVLRSMDEAIASADAAQGATKQVLAQVRAELIEGACQGFDKIIVANAIAKNKGKKLKKLQTSNYQDEGAFPIIDQGASFICGYTDDQSVLWPYTLPVIVFGDHTRTLKFVDFPFAIGADGTQCITPVADFDARFFYFALQSLDLCGEGYARHFKLLKEQTIPLPDMPTQLEIADQLAALEQSIAAASSTRQRLRNTKRALMSDLLFGRVRVPA